MKRIASLLPKRRPDAEDGFTITELIAGLLLSAILMAGLIDVTRRFAQSTERVKTVSAELRSESMLGVLFQELERADPGTLVITSYSLRAQVGSGYVKAVIQDRTGRGPVLSWSSRTMKRLFQLPASAIFEKRSSGLVVLKARKDGSILAMADPKRTVPYDCQFDTIVRECRQ